MRTKQNESFKVGLFLKVNFDATSIGL